MGIELRDETDYAGGEVWSLDQGDLRSVTRFAVKFTKEVSRLDVLVANAGVLTRRYEATKDGFESTCVCTFGADFSFLHLVNNASSSFIHRECR
ncbi:hypothetical protein BDV98DRAFT_566525 [Pterulicium gracile]|uniref:Uncharacterized protein n=1 Tax=Pterulicium gracile TaxID=1884261 RepID=A0A5C3QUK6_9AGAR|nr:hypothetical protein BDV98DRAFT_566525 [Pterula gracilis]